MPADQRAAQPRSAWRHQAPVLPPDCSTFAFIRPADLYLLTTHCADRTLQIGTPGGTRTPNLRFWRPLLCQLSYWRIWARIRDSIFGIVEAAAPPSKSLSQITSASFPRVPIVFGIRRSGYPPFESLIPNLDLSSYSTILATTPAPTVRPPSRIAKRRPSSIAIGAISVTTIFTLSPGITISTPSGSSHAPVTSVVRK